MEKPKGGLFHSAWESRTNSEIPTFPQPQQQQAFSGYISNGSTGSARVTFLDGLTRSPTSRDELLNRRPDLVQRPFARSPLKTRQVEAAFATNLPFSS